MGPGTDAVKPAGAVPRSLFKKNSLDEMTVRRTEKPVPGRHPGEAGFSPRREDAKPIVRERAGIGSYEDSGDTGSQKRRPGKTGRPGR